MKKIILFFLLYLLSYPGEKITFKNNSTEISFGKNGEIEEIKFNGDNILKKEGFLSIYERRAKKRDLPVGYN
jgi:hypothetical protein